MAADALSRLDSGVPSVSLATLLGGTQRRLLTHDDTSTRECCLHHSLPCREDSWTEHCGQESLRRQHVEAAVERLQMFKHV